VVPSPLGEAYGVAKDRMRGKTIQENPLTLFLSPPGERMKTLSIIFHEFLLFCKKKIRMGSKKPRTLKGAATTPNKGLWFLLPYGEAYGVAKARMRGKQNIKHPLTLILSPKGRGKKSPLIVIFFSPVGGRSGLGEQTFM
jgi:hypothetical protein